VLGHARLEPGDHVAHAPRRAAGGPLERGQLIDLVDHPQPIGRIDEKIGGVLDES